MISGAANHLLLIVSGYAKYRPFHFLREVVMDSSKPVRMLCTYRVRDGKEGDFLALLEKHWPTLRNFDLATDDPVQVFRSRTKTGKTVFVEMFSWKDAAAPDIAHQTPEVMLVWEPMLALADRKIFLPVEAVTMNLA